MRQSTGASRTLLRGVALLCLCLGFMAVQGQSAVLPAVTQYYYTMVTAGFGDLLYSLHYEEYGNTAALFTLSLGRYYAPSTVEYTDWVNNLYYLEITDTSLGYYYETCNTYTLSTIENNRIMLGSTQLLGQMRNSSLQFTVSGLTTSTRSQPTIHYTATLNWDSSSVPNSYFEVDEFITEAHNAAGVDTSIAYSVSVAVDVYFGADTHGNPVLVGGAYMPVRYSLTGSRTDARGTRQINIVYDFMQWSQQDWYTIDYALTPPYWWCTPVVNGTYPPGIPHNSSQAAGLGSPNATLPYWPSGRAALELTTTGQSYAIQMDSLLKSQHGLEILIFLSDANAYGWYSMLYNYDFLDERDFQFANGAVYTLNGTDANPYNEWDFDFTWQFCTGQVINPNNISPIQWTNAANLNSFFANPNFMKGAVYGPRVMIRGIYCDSWSISKTVAYNGAVYNYTMTLYVTSPGWINLGRSSVNLSPQIIRIQNSGMKYPVIGNASPYTVTMDFYMQYAIKWETWRTIFEPSWYNCPGVHTGLPMIPPLPPQFSVTVSEAWYDSSTSSQYTVYVDSNTGLRRIDGRFTAPQTMSMLSSSPISADYMNVVEWTQNVSLTSGFSSLTQNQAYSSYQQNLAPVCGAVTLSAFDFNGASTLNFFDWLATADLSQGYYVDSANIRGMDLDIYQVATQSENFGKFVLSVFQIYYLAADETMINDIPVMAEVSVSFYNYVYFGQPAVQYQFYNFRQGVPPGAFTMPNPRSCTGLPLLPHPVIAPPYYEDPDPLLDGTPTTAPTWPATFSMLIEGQFFANLGDTNIYVARWYVDFNNFRERLDIEQAFNISAANGMTPLQATYIYYYNKKINNTFAFNDGTFVKYDGTGCSAASITSTNMNPLKQVPPGNLFDTFFPQTTQTLSNQSIYNIDARWSWARFDGVFYDEYDWNFNTTFNSKTYNLQQRILISIPEWIVNAQAGNFSSRRIPLSIQATGGIYSGRSLTSNYDVVFRTTHFQAGSPGLAYFDAGLLGCKTTTSSPWYNIYGDQTNNVQPPVSDSSVSTSTVVGAVVGVLGGIFVLAGLFFGYRWWKRGNPHGMKFASSGKKANNTNDNELVGVGKVASDDGPENSLNHASLNNLVKEGGDLEVEVQIHETDAAPTTTNSADA